MRLDWGQPFFYRLISGLGQITTLSYEDRSLELEKKRRLSFDQVKALENSFEFDNKLESERKVKLAEELGLQPRQVTIWLLKENMVFLSLTMMFWKLSIIILNKNMKLLL